MRDQPGALFVINSGMNDKNNSVHGMKMITQKMWYINKYKWKNHRKMGILKKVSNQYKK